GSGHRQTDPEPLPTFTSVNAAIHTDVVEHVDGLVGRVLRIEHHLAGGDVWQVKSASRAVERRPGLAKVGCQEDVANLVGKQRGVVRQASGETGDQVNLSVHCPGQEVLRGRWKGNRAGTHDLLIQGGSDAELSAVDPLQVDVGDRRAPIDADREETAAGNDDSL